MAHVVASGMFPSKEAAIDAAVDALREKTEPIPMVPEEHMEEVERAIEESRAGLSTPMTAEDWAELRQRVGRVREAARNVFH